MAQEHDIDTGSEQLPDSGADLGEAGGEESLRDTIDRAFEESATDDVDTPAGRARDSQGRFAPGKQGPGEAAGGPQDAQTPPRQGQGSQQPQQAPQAGQAGQPELRAPASWRPSAREKWAQLDPEVKAEVQRREGEAQQLLQQGAGARQFIEAFERTVAPYEMFIRQEGSNPLAAVQNLLQTAADLRVGTPTHKANLVAGIIRNFGVDLTMLDGILAGMMNGGQIAQQPGGAPQEFRDPRFDQFLAQTQMYHQQQLAVENEQMAQGLAQFSDTHEFYRDVAATMADIVEYETRQGRVVDLEKIYHKACQIDDNVSTILNQRAAASQAAGNRQAVLRARRAAVSVKGEPTLGNGATAPRDSSVRAAVEAAFDTHGRDA